MVVKSYYARGSHFGRVMMMCGNTKAAAGEKIWKIRVKVSDLTRQHKRDIRPYHHHHEEAWSAVNT
tara:strand:+ start:306 stop:503 length:198 start_codon:yes stop_codon:yes gene_type:complete